MSKHAYPPAVIGTTTDIDETEVALNLGSLIGSHAIAVANSGGGKSGLIRKLLEVTHGQVQHIVLDVEDDFYTLRERFDYLVAGGENGDCPATPDNAAELATMLLTHGISAIIQLNDLGARRQQDFVRIFLETMVAAPRSLWHPVLVVLDEAQRLAAQDGSATCGEAVKDFMGRGRKRGFTAVLATPRNSQISKDVTGMVNNWFLGRVGQATDRRVACDALGFSPSSADGRSLQTMVTRTFWAFGPAVSPVPIQVKIDAVKTTMLKAGEVNVIKLPAPAAMKKLLAEMAKAAQKADKGAEKGPLAADVAGNPYSGPPGPSPAEIERIRSEAYDAGWDDGLQKGVGLVLQDLRPLLVKFDTLRPEEVEGMVTKPSPIPPRIMTPIPRTKPYRGLTLRDVMTDHEADGGKSGGQYIPSLKGTVREEGDGVSLTPFKPTAPQQRIIDALAAWQAIKPGPVERVTLAFLADASSKSSAYTNNLGALRTAGVLDYPGRGTVDLTDTGRTLAAKQPRRLTNDAVQRAFLEKLDNPKRRIIEALIEDWPDGVSRERLAERVGASATSSAYTNNLGNLRGLGLLDYPTRGAVQATAALFPFGR